MEKEFPTCTGVMVVVVRCIYSMYMTVIPARNNQLGIQYGIFTLAR